MGVCWERVFLPSMRFSLMPLPVLYSIQVFNLWVHRLQSLIDLPPVMKRNSIYSPKGVSLQFNNVRGRVLGQGKSKVSIILAKCVLIMPFFPFADPDD